MGFREIYDKTLEHCETNPVNIKRKKLGLLTACVCIAAVGIMIWHGLHMYQDQGSGTLPGEEEIYPTVMVNGQLYEWRKGRAIYDEHPGDCLYYGNVIHVKKNRPENDCEFVSTFSANGDIYTTSDGDCVYICLSTEWMENTFVAFDAIITG